MLPNGFTLLVSEDHSDPLVRVELTFHVGAARETVGKTGFAHLFEHMLLFEGTAHVEPGQGPKLLAAAGGKDINGTTNGDKTSYYETLPVNQLETSLYTPAEYPQLINADESWYYTNAKRLIPDRNVPAGMWSGRNAWTLSYARGMLYFANLDGQLLRPEPGAFGPGVASRLVPSGFFDLGFAEPVTLQAGKRIAGLVAGGPAALAGLHGGDELAEAVNLIPVYGSFDQFITLRVRRGAGVVAITY